MGYSELIEFIDPAVLVVVPVLIALGRMMKKTPNMKNWMIPYILTAIGVVLATSIYVLNDGVQGLSILNGILQGVLASAAAVYVYQLYIQAKDKRKSDTDEKTDQQT